MLRTIIALLALTIVSTSSATTPAIAWSNGRTLRIDLYHTQHGTEERFGIHQLRAEGTWPGITENLTTDRGLGDYRYTITNGDNNILYRDGFDSNNEDDTLTIDTIRIPYPKSPVTLTLQTASSTTLLTTTIHPDDPAINHAPLMRAAHVTALVANGPPHNHLDLSIIGDGYTDEHDFLNDARRATRYLFATTPYREHQRDFNIRALFAKSQDNGISSPLDHRWKNTPLGATYNAHNSERQIDITHPDLLHDIAAIAPYDYLLIITNSHRYGGSAAYHRYAIIAMKSTWARYLVVHELAHHLAGLADEYFTLATCKPPDHEPWKPNITTNGLHPKWADLIAPDTPLPTPWSKNEYTTFDTQFANTYFELRKQHATEGEVDQLIRTTVPRANALLAATEWAHRIGAFEGAAGTTCGMYRPATDCTMFTLRSDHFCAVCQRALTDAITHETQ